MAFDQPVMTTHMQPSSQVPNVFEEPGAVNQPLIFEPNPPLTAGVNEVWILATGGPKWGGGDIHVSTDGSTYKYVGTVYSGGRQGVLTAPLSAFAGANPDGLPHFLAVDLGVSGGSLISASAVDAANLVSLCFCDGELLSYETANLVGPSLYNLVTLYRGLYGTTANAHTVGSEFAYLGAQRDIVGLLKYDYPPSFVGVTISVKIRSFNQFLTVGQPLEECQAYEYTLNGRGAVHPVNVPFSYAGIPQNNVPVLNYTFGAGDNFPTALAGSVCSSGVAATSSTTFNISKNGANFATMIFGAGATFATFSSAQPQNFISGDILKITPARTDATLANLTGNLAGSA